jgi:hypothetical protein
MFDPASGMYRTHVAGVRPLFQPFRTSAVSTADKYQTGRVAQRVDKSWIVQADRCQHHLTYLSIAPVGNSRREHLESAASTECKGR